mmetsp:Transcript_18302/g.44077  ORF Transcript_18302/g.44077 Transcript_18302/m.44077 type:complete len:211 (-) Transcript_18302:122-754(-)
MFRLIQHVELRLEPHPLFIPLAFFSLQHRSSPLLVFLSQQAPVVQILYLLLVFPSPFIPFFFILPQSLLALRVLAILGGTTLVFQVIDSILELLALLVPILLPLLQQGMAILVGSLLGTVMFDLDVRLIQALPQALDLPQVLVNRLAIGLGDPRGILLEDRDLLFQLGRPLLFTLDPFHELGDHLGRLGDHRGPHGRHGGGCGDGRSRRV